MSTNSTIESVGRFEDSRCFQLRALPLCLNEPLISCELRKNSLISIDHGSRPDHLQLLDYALLRMNINSRRKRLKRIKTALHNANPTFSDAIKRSFKHTEANTKQNNSTNAGKGTKRHNLAGPHQIVVKESIEQANTPDLRRMHCGTNRKICVLIKYTSYLVESRYTNAAEALRKEAIQPNTSLSVFAIDSHHACSNATVHFAQTLTELTLNLVSGGDFRRKPEIKTSPSPISTMDLLSGGNRIEIFCTKTRQITPGQKFTSTRIRSPSQHGSHHWESCLIG